MSARSKLLVALSCRKMNAEENFEEDLFQIDDKKYGLRSGRQIVYNRSPEESLNSSTSYKPTDSSASFQIDSSVSICSDSANSESPITEYSRLKVVLCDNDQIVKRNTDHDIEIENEKEITKGADFNIIGIDSNYTESLQTEEFPTSNDGDGNDVNKMEMDPGKEFLSNEEILQRNEIELITREAVTEHLINTDGNVANVGNTNANIIDKNVVDKNIDGIIVKFGQIVQEPLDTVEHCASTRPWTKKSSCPYCFKEITHLPRHLQRNHKEEGAVKELLAIPLKDPKRKQILDAIRKQGNYIFSNCNKIIRPVRRPKFKWDKNTTDNQTIPSNVEEGIDKYVTCPDCLGFFKRNFLRRHRKKCSLRLAHGQNRENHLSLSQMFTICAGTYNEFYDSLRLKKEVFPIMRADEISKVAMSDVLICSYAESLLRKHKRIQMVNVGSNKMRELGRFFIVIKQTTAAQRLFDILLPEFFDNIISATKLISGYNAETQTFKASSLALHMGTTLKQVCDMATKLVIKRSRFLPFNDQERSLKNIKRTRHLIDSHWSSELSSLALKNLNEKRWEKPKLFPLTSDIIDFQKYIMNEAKQACENIQNGKQLSKAYKKLAENVLALTLLLNRKRIGEIQYLKVSTYTKEVSTSQQEEFLSSLSETEKLLTKNFKRIITGGKGSKPVAVLFPQTLQKFIKVMLDIRGKCVPDTNEYLFANNATKNRWLSGYHVIKKLAHQSGVKNQELFTSTRLRKQIATVLQVINLTDTEMEQFAAFMGHTKKTHEEHYRLPQDVYQTAKVSKLLLAISQGKGAHYKGKTLDEIDFSDNEDSAESDSEPELDKSTNQQRVLDSASTSHLIKVQDEIDIADEVYDPPININSGTEDKVMTRTKIKRGRWTSEQKHVVQKFFGAHIANKQAPKKKEVEELMKQNKQLFIDKNWVTVKAFVYNCYKNK